MWPVSLKAIALLATALAVPHRAVLAQQKGMEFTQQGLLVANFWPARDKDFKLGRKAADAVRDRVGKYLNKKEVDVISGYDIKQRLEISGYNPDTNLTAADLRSLGRRVRADEYIAGTIAKSGEGFTIGGQMVLVRNARIGQPLASATNKELDLAADQFAREIAAAHKQLIPLRRCENAIREGKAAAAVEAARTGIAAYPRASLARTCMVVAMRAAGFGATDVLQASRELAELDPTNPYALESMAVALDSLRRRDEAGDAWLKLAATDMADVDLIERVVFALVDDGNVRKAEPLILRAVQEFPDTLRLVRQKWRVLFELKKWPSAIETGERMLAMDSLAAHDSSFILRLGNAYRASEKPLKAMEIAVRGVNQFPGDARLYGFYAQMVKGENDVVLPRGIALFPKSAELLALNAKDLRARGKLEESLAASKQAVVLDSSLAQGQLVIAQTEFDLGRPDSALATVRRALMTAAAAPDSQLVAQFSLAKGNALLRAANGTKKREDYVVAMHYLSLADSLRSTPQTKFLLGASAMSVTQQALTEAPKLPEKAQSCELSRLGSETLPIARASLEAGQEVQPEAVKQYLAYLDQIAPFAEKQIAAFCT